MDSPESVKTVKADEQAVSPVEPLSPLLKNLNLSPVEEGSSSNPVKTPEVLAVNTPVISGEVSPVASGSKTPLMEALADKVKKGVMNSPKIPVTEAELRPILAESVNTSVPSVVPDVVGVTTPESRPSVRSVKPIEVPSEPTRPSVRTVFNQYGEDMSYRRSSGK